MQELKFHIDESRCIRCGVCIRDCAPAILEFDPERGVPRVIPGADDGCTRCQHCLAVCPCEAVSIFGRDPAKSIPGGTGPAPEAMLSLIANRRSVRSYRHENLDRATLDKLKAMLCYVPTGVNSHTLHFAFIDEVEVMDSFRDYVAEKVADMLADDPQNPFLTRMERYRKQFAAGRDVIFRNAPHMVVAAAKIGTPCEAQDPVIALSYFELYAQSLGVGTLWCGLAQGALGYFPELMTRLGLPEGWRASYCMLFGPPNVRYPRAVQPEPFGMNHVR